MATQWILRGFRAILNTVPPKGPPHKPTQVIEQCRDDLFFKYMSIIYICMYVCVCQYTHTHIYIDTEKKAEKFTYRIIAFNLSYSIRNSAQWYVAAWMGGEFGGKCIHVYV